MYLLTSLLTSLATSCEPHCVENVCSELNGNVAVECGSCHPDSSLCHPGANGFALSSPNDLRLRQQRQEKPMHATSGVAHGDAQSQSSHLPLPWRTDICSVGLPKWLDEALRVASDRPASETEAAARARCAGNGIAEHYYEYPSSAPSFDGTATAVSAVPRRNISELTAAQLYFEAASLGSPLVLQGLHESTAEWARSLESIRTAIGLPMSSPASTPSSSPTAPVTSAAAAGQQSTICQSAECAHALPFDDVPSLRRLLDSSPPDAPRAVTTGLAIFHGPVGARFGGPFHWDQTCHPVISIQRQGTKQWTLWAPSGWATHSADADGDADADSNSDAASDAADDAQDEDGEAGSRKGGGGGGKRGGGGGSAKGGGGDIAVRRRVYQRHERVEATLREGDAILFFPGWYHATRVLGAEKADDKTAAPAAVEDSAAGSSTYSIATSQNIQHLTPYAALPRGFARNSPLGYSNCARGERGWDALTTRWERAFGEPRGKDEL